jgi:hypothetical protein
MAINHSKNAATEVFCNKQNRSRRWSILPWNRPPVPVSTHSEAHPSEGGVVKPNTPEHFESLAQAGNPLAPAELHSLYAGTSVPPHRYLAPALVSALHSPAIALDPASWFSDIVDIDLSSVAGTWLRTNGDTSFEQLKSVEFDLSACRLTAVVTIKQRCGYSGGPSTAGSREFVAFWADWGFGFRYEGTASVEVHDCSSRPDASQDDSLALSIDLSSRTHDSGEATKPLRVRAVLSWNTPPSTTHPYAQAAWGNSLDRRIGFSSFSEVGSGQQSTFPSSLRCDHSASVFSADDLEDRGPSFTQCRWSSVELVRDSPSC